jgi:MFS family permease
MGCKECTPRLLCQYPAHMTQSPTAPRKALLLAFSIVFFDMIGFSVLFPLFPSLLEHYVTNEGPDSLVGQLSHWLSGLAAGTDGGVEDMALYAFFGGILGSLYSVLQFLFAPYWGSLSDTRGRRPVLLLTLGGTAISYVVWFFAGPFWLLIVARLVGGIMAGNISTATAVVADVTDGANRAKGMGMIGAGIGLGFVLGPALGGLTAGWDLTKSLPGLVPYGLNPFSGCALIAFVISLMNFIVALRFLPETLPPKLRGANAKTRTLHPFKALKSIDNPSLRRTNLAYFSYLLAFAAMEFTLAFMTTSRLDFTPMDNAYMFIFVGLTIALVQGGLVRRLSPILGEGKLGRSGIMLTVPGFLLVGLTHSVGQLYLGLAFLAVGSAFVMPSLSSLASRLSPRESQGFSLGIFRSMGSAARAAGPILGGALFFSWASEAPYLLGAVFLFIPLLLLRGVSAPEDV